MTKNNIKNKGEDNTLEKNALKHWEFLIKEYELIKDKKHVKFFLYKSFTTSTTSKDKTL
jgi:hypothetical protein